MLPQAGADINLNIVVAQGTDMLNLTVLLEAVKRKNHYLWEIMDISLKNEPQASRHLWLRDIMRSKPSDVNWPDEATFFVRHKS
jgi:hypothetical protein